MLTEEAVKHSVLENVSVVGNSVYVTTRCKTINELIRIQMLNYNYEIQRQAKVKNTRSIIQKPTVYEECKKLKFTTKGG